MFPNILYESSLKLRNLMYLKLFNLLERHSVVGGCLKQTEKKMIGVLDVWETWNVYENYKNKVMNVGREVHLWSTVKVKGVINTIM